MSELYEILFEIRSIRDEIKSDLKEFKSINNDVKNYSKNNINNLVEKSLQNMINQDNNNLFKKNDNQFFSDIIRALTKAKKLL